MAKAWAKIEVWNYGYGLYMTRLKSDVGWGNLYSPGEIASGPPQLTRRQALARARAWSRRLGGIPVEVED
jgi:hypothetical protein